MPRCSIAAAGPATTCSRPRERPRGRACIGVPLPAIEPVAPRALPPPDRRSDEPEHGENDRSYPQDMERKASSGEDQNDEE